MEVLRVMSGPLFTWGCRINEGFYFNKELVEVEVIVRNIYNSRFGKQVWCEVRGVQNYEFLIFSKDRGLVSVVEGVRIGLSRGKSRLYKVPLTVEVKEGFYKEFRLYD